MKWFNYIDTDNGDERFLNLELVTTPAFKKDENENIVSAKIPLVTGYSINLNKNDAAKLYGLLKYETILQK